jgi:GNAT superfamily N-acetyltransferase
MIKQFIQSLKRTENIELIESVLNGYNIIFEATTPHSNIDEIEGGNADNLTIGDISKKHNVGITDILEQLKKGTEIEMEHTNDLGLAEEIAMDHLEEFPDYYTRLEEMEREAKSNESIIESNELTIAADNPMVGIEKQVNSFGDVIQYKDEYGSVRFIKYLDSKPIAGIQIMERGNNPVIANIYVVPEYRRNGLGTELYNLAKSQYPTLGHNTHRTIDGEAFINSLNESLNYPSDFNIDEFKELKSFAGRKRYADEKLKRIGSGSARIVYAIDDETVMKLAKNKKGLAQNYVEGDWGLHSMYKGLVPDLIDADEDDRWIIMQRAKKITPKEFERITGFKFSEFGAALRNQINKNRGQKNYFAVPENIDEILDDEFTNQVIDLVMNFDLEPGDLDRISSYGKLSDESDPVLTDVGLTRSVWKEHYAR